MIGPRELAMAIYGVCRLAALDRSAVQYFENTEEAFWKSFNAAIIALPGYVLLTLLVLVEQPVEASGMRIAAVEGISYAIGWVLFPLVMVSFTEAANCRKDYFRFLSAWNWSAVLQVYFLLAVTAFGASGTLPQELSALVGLTAVLALLFYQGFIAHAMLGVRPAIAALIVAIDIGLGLVLEAAQRLLY